MSNNKKATVIHIKRRVIISLLVLIAAAIMSAVVLAATSSLSDSARRDKEIGTILDNYIEYSGSALDMMMYSYSIGLQKLSKKTALNASALRRTADEWSGDDSIPDVRLYKDGCLFRYDGRNAEFPAGLPADMNTGVIRPEEESGVMTDHDAEKQTNGKYAIEYAKIKDDLYYMEWELFDDSDMAAGNIDWDAILESIADTHDILIIELQKDETGDYSIIGGSDEFSSYAAAEDLGLSDETIEASMGGRSQLVRILDDSYLIQTKVREAEGTKKDGSYTQGMSVVALMPAIDIFKTLDRAFLAFVLTMLIFGIALIAWIVFTFHAVSGGTREEAEAEKLRPSDMKRKVIIYILISTLIIGCCCAFSYSLSNLFVESTHDSKALKNISKSVSASKNGNRDVWEESKKEYIEEAEEIAAILDEHPQLRNAEWLKEASGIIGADYIMLFDAGGDEMLTDSRYRRLSLGSDESSATYDFRRLLKGVRSISHEKLTDEITGLTRDMYGVSLNYAGNGDDAYGALIIAVDPEERFSYTITEKLDNINALLSAHSVGDYLSFAVDPGTGKIEYSSDAAFVGRDAVNSGLDDTRLKDSFIGFFDFGSARRYGRSAEIDDLLYYFSSGANRMFYGIGSFSETCMILYLIIIALTACLMMHGYNNATYEKMLSGKAADKDNGAEKTKHPASVKGKVFKAFGISGSPFRKAMMMLLMLASIVLIVMMFMALQSGMSSGADSVLDYIMNGEWDRGINIFAMTAIFLVLGNAVLVIAALYALRVALGSVLNSRGSTVSALITSVLQYLTAIIATFIALGYLGVDYRALLASVGIMSMALSFGAKDFVADIFAGINLLTNNAYKIGDIVEIGGYRGTVREISLRATRLADSRGNIKTIRNSTIGDVVNLSAENAICIAEITVSIDNDLSEVEALLERELPEIGKNHPQFINGPEYKGISSMGGGRETILIQTECRQEDYSYVVSAVNREMQLLLKKNGIEIL